MTDDEVKTEALRRFPWCFPPESDKEDARRAADGKPPRDWRPTREQALKQAAELLNHTENSHAQ